MKEPQLSPQDASSETYRSVILRAGPVAYWRLGESAGASTAFDETPNAHHGKYLSAPRFEQPGAISGDGNRSVTFDGTSSVEIPNDPAFSQPTSAAGLTVEAWVRPDKLVFPEQYIHWLGKGAAGQFEWGFRFYSASDVERPNRMSAYVWNPNGGRGAGAYFQDTIVVGEWIHVVACFEPGDASVGQAGVQIYKNGACRKGPPHRGTLYKNPNPDGWNIMPAHGIAPVRIGTRDLRTFLIGGLDEVAIYPRVLTADEIRLHYDVGVG